MTRRTFLAAAASLPLAHAAPARPKLTEFAYAGVSLSGGPMAAQLERLRRHYLALDNDRLLKVYRQRAGLPAPGDDMGGWYDADGFVPGHLIGQFISGLSRVAANTKDAAAAAKAQALVSGYAATLGANDYPFAAAKASTTWPCYILDKYEIGLLDAASLIACDQARRLLPRVIAGAAPYIPGHVYDRGPDSPKQAPYDEPYILPENLFRVYQATGDRRYCDMAKRYLLDVDLFDPLAAGRNVLPGKHGYSHAIALSSGAKAYEMLGAPKYLRAIRNAWDMLEQTQQYASGAWAPQETFVRPHQGELAASLASTHDHFETPCGYYAHSKLARYLLAFTADARYGDGLERVLLNTVLGAIDPGADGEYFYYSDYHAQARKGYYKRKWPCCAGTLLQSVADYPLNLYFRGPESIYVNLFAESEVRWSVNGVPVTIAQHTAFPTSEEVELRVIPQTSVEFTLHVRIPAWAGHRARILVNGKSVDAAPGAFASIRRKWRKNDSVQLTLPFTFRTVPIDDRNPRTVALMWGPLLMVAIDPPPGLAAPTGALLSARPVPGNPLEFQYQTTAGPIRLKPFYQVRNEVYSTYWSVSL